MRRSWLQLLLLGGVCLGLLTACHDKGSRELSSAEAKSFDQAPAEIQKMWAAAVQAAQTNDYVGAENLLYGLLNAQQLSPDQKAAVSKKLGEVNDEMYASLSKGDPNAQKAVEELRRNPPFRPH